MAGDLYINVMWQGVIFPMSRLDKLMDYVP